MRLSVARLLSATVFCLLMVTTLQAADHLEAPGVMGNGDVDLADLYIFESPTNSNNAVLALTVNPFSGTTSGTSFRSVATANYQFQIDNNGDNVADFSYTAGFSEAVGGVQTVTLSRDLAGGASTVLGSGQTETNIATAGGTLRAGQFDDPFFFDFAGFNNGFNFTGVDTFAGANVSGIVLEVPKADLLIGGTGTNVGVQAVTEVGGTQFDRMGRPAIATALIPSGRKDEFNQASPANDLAAFGSDVEATITALSGDAAYAAAVTPALLPDLLTYDTTNPGGFLNGRRLTDDVIDAELALLTNGGLTTDGVGANDVAFQNVFPYLAAPNPVAVPEPSSAALLMLAALGMAARRPRRRDDSIEPTSYESCSI